MQRFFVPPQAFTASQVTLKDDLAHQINRVLRMSSGEQVIVLDNSGWEYEVQLTDVAPKEVHGEIIEKRLAEGEPRLRLTLYQSLLKRDNFEWVLQKCTEIGVARFVPMLCERTIPTAGQGKLERWEKIIQEAAEQSRRGRLPTLETPLRLKDALAQARQHTRALIPWEQETSLSLRQALAAEADQTINSVGLFIGPEGGFAEAEIELAHQNGVQPVTLGKRILRSETAAVTAAALVLHTLGEME